MPVGGNREGTVFPVCGNRGGSQLPVGGNREGSALPVGGNREALVAYTNLVEGTDTVLDDPSELELIDAILIHGDVYGGDFAGVCAEVSSAPTVRPPVALITDPPASVPPNLTVDSSARSTSVSSLAPALVFTTLAAVEFEQKDRWLEWTAVISHGVGVGDFIGAEPNTIRLTSASSAAGFERRGGIDFSDSGSLCRWTTITLRPCNSAAVGREKLSGRGVSCCSLTDR